MPLPQGSLRSDATPPPAGTSSSRKLKALRPGTSKPTNHPPTRCAGYSAPSPRHLVSGSLAMWPPRRSTVVMRLLPDWHAVFGAMRRLRTIPRCRLRVARALR